jgi:hypothetical protein
VVSIGLSLVILAVVSLSRMGKTTGSEIRGIESAFQEMAQSAERAAERTAAKAAVPPETVIVRADQREGAVPLGGACTVVGGVLRRANLIVVSEKPPALTPEQIGRHEIGDPWLYKIEADQWELKPGSNGEVTGTAPARLNIDHRGFRQRTVGDATLTGKWNEHDRTLALSLTFQSTTPPGDSNTPGIQYMGMNAYRIYLKSAGTFTEKTEAPADDAAAKAAKTAPAHPGDP